MNLTTIKRSIGRVNDIAELKQIGEVLNARARQLRERSEEAKASEYWGRVSAFNLKAGDTIELRADYVVLGARTLRLRTGQRVRIGLIQPRARKIWFHPPGDDSRTMHHYIGADHRIEFELVQNSVGAEGS